VQRAGLLIHVTFQGRRARWRQLKPADARMHDSPGQAGCVRDVTGNQAVAGTLIFCRRTWRKILRKSTSASNRNTTFIRSHPYLKEKQMRLLRQQSLDVLLRDSAQGMAIYSS
jgi:hypothetical protein